jgi:hypothetical protein
MISVTTVAVDVQGITYRQEFEVAGHCKNQVKAVLDVRPTSAFGADIEWS